MPLAHSLAILEAASRPNYVPTETEVIVAATMMATQILLPFFLIGAQALIERLRAQ